MFGIDEAFERSRRAAHDQDADGAEAEPSATATRSPGSLLDRGGAVVAALGHPWKSLATGLGRAGVVPPWAVDAAIRLLASEAEPHSVATPAGAAEATIPASRPAQSAPPAAGQGESEPGVTVSVSLTVAALLARKLRSRYRRRRGRVGSFARDGGMTSHDLTGRKNSAQDQLQS